MARVLVIDDDELIRNSLSRCFADMGHEVLLAGDLAQGRGLARAGVDVIYLDLHLPDGEGQSAIDDLVASPGRPEIIVITGLGDNFGAEETLARGAWDYIQKPASPGGVRASLESALEYRRERRRNQEAPPELDDSGIIGGAPSIQRAKELIARAAESEANVLILGETGVGKELAAQAIHANSRRRGGPFIVVDCSNLTETLVESVLYGHVKGAFTGAHADRSGLVAEAHGGTLFLDEVGELPMPLQKSFLRVLQEHRFRPVGGAREQVSDFRLVAATNRDLEAMTHSGKFRSDLLFRLRTLELALPPLRERGQDTALLAGHFAGLFCRRSGLPPKKLSPDLLQVLARYAWPGNVRELANVLEAAVIGAGQDPVLHPKHLPGHVRVSSLPKARKRKGQATGPARDEHSGPLTYEEYKAARDRDYFQQLMEICEGDVTRASSLSGLSVPSVYRHLGLAGISTRGKTKR